MLGPQKRGRESKYAALSCCMWEVELVYLEIDCAVAIGDRTRDRCGLSQYCTPSPGC